MIDEKWIPVTYEKLLDFCYACGKLGHMMKDCDSDSSPRKKIHNMVRGYGVHYNLDNTIEAIEMEGIHE